jgi:hypothetical protein
MELNNEENGKNLKDGRKEVMVKWSSYLTGDTLRLRYKVQPVNAM